MLTVVKTKEENNYNTTQNSKQPGCDCEALSQNSQRKLVVELVGKITVKTRNCWLPTNYKGQGYLQCLSSMVYSWEMNLEVGGEIYELCLQNLSFASLWQCSSWFSTLFLCVNEQHTITQSERVFSLITLTQDVPSTSFSTFDTYLLT